MRRVVMLVLVLCVLGSWTTTASVQIAFSYDSKSPIEPDDKPQTFWVKIAVLPGYYTDMRAALAIAIHDPNWKAVYIPALGGYVAHNPALTVFVDYSLTTRSLSRTTSSYPQNQDTWIAWTKLPPIPTRLVGIQFTYQVLCWNNVLPQRFALTSHSEPFGSGSIGASMMSYANLVIVPK